MLEQSTISSKSFSVFVSKFPSIGVKILVSLARYGSLFWLSALHVRIKCSLVSSPSSHMTQVGLTSYLLNFALFDCSLYVFVTIFALKAALREALVEYLLPSHNWCGKRAEFS